MKTVCILGIGSPSGDDQAGWLVIQALENRLPPGVEAFRLDRPGSALIGLLEKAARVILIDAMQGNGNPGDIHHFANDEWADYRTGLSSHGLGVFEALMLARELSCLPEKIDLYGMEIGSALPGDQPCEAVITAAEKLANRFANNWHGQD